MKNNELVYVVVIFWLLALIPLIPYYDEQSYDPPTSSSIKVMTYNIHFGQNFDGIYDIEGIGKVIDNQRPNIVGFQEVTFQSPFNGYTTMLSELTSMMTSLGFKYSYSSDGYNYNLGNTIFSQFPIKEKSTINFDDWIAWQRSAVEVIVDVNGELVTIYSTHLTHIPSGGMTGEVRVKEVNQLLDYIADRNTINGKYIVLGDFNIVPVDDDGNSVQEYILITNSLKDAWVEFSNDPGYTSPADNPDKRIDYVFTSQNINTTSCEVFPTLASDHLPLTCIVDLS